MVHRSDTSQSQFLSHLSMGNQKGLINYCSQRINNVVCKIQLQTQLLYSDFCSIMTSGQLVNKKCSKVRDRYAQWCISHASIYLHLSYPPSILARIWGSERKRNGKRWKRTQDRSGSIDPVAGGARCCTFTLFALWLFPRAQRRLGVCPGKHVCVHALAINDAK